jgi:protein ImuA
MPPPAAPPVAAGSALVPLKERPPQTGRNAGGTAAPSSICPFSSSLAPDTPPGLPFGIEEIDSRLPQGGLNAHGLNEFKPGSVRDASTALALILTLAARVHRGPVLIVLSGRAETEHGLPYGPGLSQLGLDPGRLLIVRARRLADALWTLEEGLRSGTLGAVLGLLDSGKGAMGVLPARRLVLAAHEGRTPCLLLTGAATEGLNVAHSRWRVVTRPSAPHPLDPAAPGAPRCALALERCRHGPSHVSWTIEWQEEGLRLAVSSKQAVDRPNRRSKT